MGLISIYAGDNDLQRIKNKEQNSVKNPEKNYITLEQIEKSHKKYSLKDLNEAIEAKYNRNHHKLYSNISEENNIEDGYNNNEVNNNTISNTIDNDMKITVPNFTKDFVTSTGLEGTATGGHIDNDQDEDILMEDISNEHDIQIVSNYLTQQRLQSSDHLVSSYHLQQLYNNNSLSNNELSLEPTKLQTVYVVDTNFIISQLQTLEGLRQLGQVYHHVLVIPTTTISELDGLKSSDSATIAKHARAGNMWIYKNLAEANSGIIGQKIRQRLNPNTYKDDSILDCCLYFKERLGCFVILLSNDKNLCLKALTEEVLTVSFREGMTSELIASKSYQENCARFGNNSIHSVPPNNNNNSELYANMHLQNAVINANINDKHIFENENYATPFTSMTLTERAEFIHLDIQYVVTTTIKSIMKDEYGEDLPYIGFQEKDLKTLQDCSRCIYDHWIAIFSDYFRHSKIKKEDWKTLPDCLTSIPKSQEDIDNMIFFWQDILENLFTKKSEQEYHQLEEYFYKWKQFKSK